ncbi:uncharacterized protein LOC103785118 [Pan paniscus]|uniref:uncharacterized protein LOC103785118 n=1 Tax=Pan paniscus TaxID=9597 RepID=UPI00300675A6
MFCSVKESSTSSRFLAHSFHLLFRARYLHFLLLVGGCGGRDLLLHIGFRRRRKVQRVSEAGRRSHEEGVGLQEGEGRAALGLGPGKVGAGAGSESADHASSQPRRHDQDKGFDRLRRAAGGHRTETMRRILSLPKSGVDDRDEKNRLSNEQSSGDSWLSIDDELFDSGTKVKCSFVK